jgi:hypothetical protein
MADILEPLTIVTYAAPKMGKTSDMLFSFPKAVFLVPNRACLAPSRKLCGYEPERKGVCPNLDSLLAKVKSLATDASVTTVVVDDISLMADQSIRDWDGGANSFAKWNKLRDTMAEIFDIARAAPWHLAIDTHETGPKDYDGATAKGGPKMASVTAGQDIAKSASLVLRAVTDTTATALPWPKVYLCDHEDADWIMGDRSHVAPKISPMNLGELLRAAGYEIPRQYDWQEELVEKGAALVGRIGQEEAFAKVVEAVTKKGGSGLAARWTLRDIYARVWFRDAAADPLAGYVAR